MAMDQDVAAEAAHYLSAYPDRPRRCHMYIDVAHYVRYKCRKASSYRNVVFCDGIHCML